MTDIKLNNSTLATASGSTITWGSGVPAGTVIQAKSAVYSTQVSNSTASYVDTGLTASITPTRSSSKILVLVSPVFYGRQNNNKDNERKKQQSVVSIQGTTRFLLQFSKFFSHY